MQTLPQPWWRTDTYEHDEAIPAIMQSHAGPNGVALVAAYGDGKTTGGWGTDPGSESGTFMENYVKNKFHEKRAVFAYRNKQQPFAFVMRSLQMLVVDIDGKNGGLEHAKKLGALPPTLAETSKSGDGYHLFYLVPDTWDSELGFNTLHDRIGIEQGVDIRATGCVYHYPSQRWNSRPPAVLPKFMHDLLLSKQQERAHRAAYVVSVIDTQDETEILMLQDQILSDLKKPIPAGKRNNTLFAIGQQMKQAQIEGWEDKIEERATEVGLSTDEIDKLVANITKYD